MNFEKGVTIPQSELEEIFSLARLAPSANNLQHAHYVVVTDPELKEKVRAAAWNQYKVHTASAAIVVLGDKRAYETAPEIYNGLRVLGALSQQEYDATIDSINSAHVGNEAFQRDEAIRNASLSAMQFMLIAKEKGWDTCPMIGFKADEMMQVLDIPDRYEPVLLITMGKAVKDNVRPRGYRKPVGEFVTFR
ncbi:putative NAD(P)H nitroreductase MhqN [compost metagenome]